jgi:hypothetical protein
MRIRLDLDPQLADALIEAAEREVRHPHQQAEAILREKLGVPAHTADHTEHEEAEVVAHAS